MSLHGQGPLRTLRGSHRAPGRRDAEQGVASHSDPTFRGERRHPPRDRTGQGTVRWLHPKTEGGGMRRAYQRKSVACVKRAEWDRMPRRTKRAFVAMIEAAS